MNRWSAASASIWLGMQLMGGYIIAPVLFKALPKLQAGNIAGDVFTILSYSGLIVWLAVWFISRQQAIKNLLTTLLLLLAANQFLITPVIQALKTEQANWLLTLTGGSFGMWHGVSRVIFLLITVLSIITTKRLFKSIV